MAPSCRPPCLHCRARELSASRRYCSVAVALGMGGTTAAMTLKNAWRDQCNFLASPMGLPAEAPLQWRCQRQARTSASRPKVVHLECRPQPHRFQSKFSSAQLAATIALTCGAAAGAASKLSRASAATTSLELPRQSTLPPMLCMDRNAALWCLARPTILIALLRTTYGIIDSFWVGRLGPNHLAAMGASSFAWWVLLILGEVACMGVQALSAAQEGAGQRDGVGRAVVQGLLFSLLVGVLALFLIPFIPSYFHLLGIPHGPVLEYGATYLLHLTWGVIPVTASGVLAAGFKGVAKLQPVLVVNAFCVALNFVLDPLLVWGGLGFPALGVAGAAVATNICALAATLMSFKLLADQGVPLKPVPPDTQTLKRITQIGLPISLGGLLFTGIYIVLGRLLGRLGDANIAALGLGHRVENLAFLVCEGFGAAAATLVGQWIGAERPEEARATARHAALAAAWVMVPVSVLFFAFAHPIVSAFTSDPATIAAAASYLKVVGVTFPLMGIELVMDGALTGAGDTNPSLVLGFVFNLMRIPIALCLCNRLGVNAVWIAISVTTLLKAVTKWWAFKRSSLPLLGEFSRNT